jgi:hypothetical protein
MHLGGLALSSSATISRDRLTNALAVAICCFVAATPSRGRAKWPRAPTSFSFNRSSSSPAIMSEGIGLRWFQHAYPVPRPLVALTNLMSAVPLLGFGSTFCFRVKLSAHRGGADQRGLLTTASPSGLSRSALAARQSTL